MPTSSWSRRSALKAITAQLVPSLAWVGAPAIAKTIRGTGSVVVYDGGGAWGEAKRKAFFEPFETETGIKVIPQPRAPSGVLRAGILAGAPKYDVFSLTGGTMYSFMKEQLLLPIDYEWWDASQRAAIQPVPALPYGVPGDYYSLMMAYGEGVTAPQNWTDFWDSTKFAGSRALAPGLTGSQGATFEAALLADGVAPDKLYPLDWARALKSLTRIRPTVIKWWGSGAEPIQLLLDKQATLVSAWNGRVSSARDQGAKIAGVWNQAILQWDAWCVPKGAQNVENAMKFIAYISTPERQAQFVEQILYGPTNINAFAHLKPERTALLPTAPALKSGQVVQDYEWWSQIDASGQTNEKRAIVEWERWLTASR